MATESQQITQMLAGRYGTANYGNLQVVKWQYYDYVRSSLNGVIPQKLIRTLVWQKLRRKRIWIGMVSSHTTL